MQTIASYGGRGFSGSGAWPRPHVHDASNQRARSLTNRHKKLHRIACDRIAGKEKHQTRCGHAWKIEEMRHVESKLHKTDVSRFNSGLQKLPIKSAFVSANWLLWQHAVCLWRQRNKECYPNVTRLWGAHEEAGVSAILILS